MLVHMQYPRLRDLVIDSVQSNSKWDENQELLEQALANSLKPLVA